MINKFKLGKYTIETNYMYWLILIVALILFSQWYMLQHVVEIIKPEQLGIGVLLALNFWLFLDKLPLEVYKTKVEKWIK